MRTPPSVTPAGTVAEGGGGGLSASTDAASAPDAAQATSRKRTTRARFSMSRRAFAPMIAAPSRPSDHHDGDVVGELAACEAAAVLGDRERERRHGKGAALREQRVEPLGSGELAVAPRLDDAVGVEHERRS